MDSASKYIDYLQTNGRLVFTTEDVADALGNGGAAVSAQLRRLKNKGLIATPFRGFHVIIPPMYRRLGCLPPDHFIHQLMEHLGEPYYVSLLSAATFHGAAHQAPMSFQVMTNRSRRSLECGGVKVDFVRRKDMVSTSVVQRPTPTGLLRIASPAATALELVGYSQHCGYLNNVATVLSELSESIDEEALKTEARRAPVAWVQRLGYLLVLLEQHELAAQLELVLAEKRVFTVPLVPWLARDSEPKDPRWNLLINTEVEPDL